jgi:hypothetical protein
MLTSAEQAHASHADSIDITNIQQRNLVVIGFFTPDYYPLASTFSQNLKSHNISHHLYARKKVEGDWVSQTRQKPSVLIQAFRDYPDSVLVLMDVDCQVRGSIAKLCDLAADVGLRLKPKKQTRLRPCGRVVVLKPTIAAQAFVKSWSLACSGSGSDEGALYKILGDTEMHYSICGLPPIYAGEVVRNATADAIIVHESASDSKRVGWNLRKVIQTSFRRSRNKLFSLSGYSKE